MMAEEEQNQKCNPNSNGGVFFASLSRSSSSSSSSKKLKQKKVPQRGLGVAQLEKIRMEEQQKKDAPLVSSSILSPPCSAISPVKPPFPSLPLPNYHHPNQPPSITYPPLPHDLPSPDSMFRPLPVPNVEPGNVSLVSSVGWPPISSVGLARAPKPWNSGDLVIEKESSWDPGFTFRANMSLPYEGSPIWHGRGLVQTPQQHHRSSSSLMNFRAATSSTSLLNFQMEPPSNQSFCGDEIPPWKEEEKTIGMKRSYPLSLDDSPSLTMNYKIPTLIHPGSRSDDSTSCGNGCSIHLKTGNNPLIRESPLYSSSITEPSLKQCFQENGVLNGDFLTLAPPTTTTSIPASKFRNPPNLSLYGSELPDFEPLPSQDTQEGPYLQQVPTGSNQQQPFYCFLPPPQGQHCQKTTTVHNLNGAEVSEGVDLNLKL